MIAQRIQIICPGCSRDLNIHVADMGKKAGCKYCGHRFRITARPRSDLIAEDDQPGPSSPGRDDRATVPGPWAEPIERELQKTWARLSAKQASMIEEMLAALGDSFAPNTPVDREPAAARPPDQLLESRDAPPEGHPSAPPGGDARDALPVPDSLRPAGEVRGVGLTGAASSADVAKWLEHLTGERDAARAECEWLRREARNLRSELSRRLAEIEPLRKSAEKLLATRAKRDRLGAECAALGREVTRLESRLVETQFALVEVEAELEDSRDRFQAERDAWQQQRRELVEEAERRHAEQLHQFEVQRDAWREQLARLEGEMARMLPTPSRVGDSG